MSNPSAASTSPTIPILADRGAAYHADMVSYAEGMAGNVALIFEVVAGRAVLPVDFDMEKLVNATRQVAADLTPWFLEQGFILRLRDCDTDPLGHFEDWRFFLANALPFIREYVSPGGLMLMAVTAGRH
jgi:hypothetical protein